MSEGASYAYRDRNDRCPGQPLFGGAAHSLEGELGTRALRCYAEELDERRLPQKAYLALRWAIRDLHLEPRRMLREREVVEALGMSRTPVREALVRLENEGWVRLVPRHGFVVTPLVADDLQQLYEVVEGLEGVAVALSTVRSRTEGLLEEFDRLIAEQEEALEANDVVTWAELDAQFHRHIVYLSGNTRLGEILDNQDDQLYRARLYTINLRPKPMRSVEEHRAIVAAMRERNAMIARELLEAHRRRGRDEILHVIRAITPGR